MYRRAANIKLVAIGGFALGLIASAARAEQWLELFGQPTIAGQVTALADFQNKLYVSGDLYSVADQRVAGLANYDYKTHQWAVVDLESGDGFISMAGFHGPDNHSLFLAPGCCSNTLTRLTNGIASEVQLAGSANQLLSIQFDSGPRVVATGSFTVDQQSFGLALWDGTRWDYQASEVLGTRDPVIFLRQGQTRLVALAQDQQTRTLVSWDGSRASYHAIPTVRPVRAIAAANERVYVCAGPELLSWDGSTWAYVLLSFGICTDLASRPTANGQELVIGTLSGQLLFTDGLRTPVPDGAFTGRFTFRTVMISTQSKLFYIGDRFTGNPYQFSVWDGAEWTFPQADFASKRDLAMVVRSEAVADRLFLFGDFLDQTSGKNFSSASWSDQGLTRFDPDNRPISAVSSDLGTVYGAVPEGLVVSTAGSSRTIPFAEDICSIEYSDIDGGQVFFLDCRGSAYRFDGNQITPAGQGQTGCFRCYGGLHAIRSPSPAAAVYAVAVVGANSGKSPFFPQCGSDAGQEVIGRTSPR